MNLWCFWSLKYPLPVEPCLVTSNRDFDVGVGNVHNVVLLEESECLLHVS